MKLVRTACIFSAIAIHGLLLASIPEPLSDVTLDTGGGASSPMAVSVGFQQTAAAKAVTKENSDPVEQEVATPVQPPVKQDKPEQELAKNGSVMTNKPEPLIEPEPQQIPQPTEPVADTIEEPDTTEQQPAPEAALASSQTIASGIHHNIITEPLFASSPTPPSYPTIARKRGQQGVVWLDIKLDKHGEQTGVEVFQSSGVRSLDRAALKAVKQWQFLAHKVGNLTVASHIRIPVEFSLD
ncbi:energy transducer TonB [Sinobacterium norvegicum]|nr:energy transducer TonB [Sinobacterium norvegicum]